MENTNDAVFRDEDAHSSYSNQRDYAIETLKNARALHRSCRERTAKFERWLRGRHFDRQFREPWDIRIFYSLFGTGMFRGGKPINDGDAMWWYLNDVVWKCLEDITNIDSQIKKLPERPTHKDTERTSRTMTRFTDQLVDTH